MTSTGVCTDSRKVLPGQIFFALKGEHFDGNVYAHQALEQGATLAVVERGDTNKKQYLKVRDVLATLQALASHHRNQLHLPVFALTGSNGKTSTKDHIARVLQTERQVQYTQGNLNNHIGVPLTLLNLRQETDVAVIEMGANHIGEIAHLCRIVRPTHGLITNIGSAHIGEFGGRENIIRAKSELFDYLRKNNGVVFINTTDEVLNNMAKRFATAIKYPNPYTTLVSPVPYVKYKDEFGELHTTHMIGTHNYLNLAAAITVGKHFGINDPYQTIDQYVSNNNRSQRVEQGSNTVILDAYNANPDSVQAALLSLAQMDSQNKVTILGDMKELGSYSADLHEQVLAYAETLGLSHKYAVGHDFSLAAKSFSCRAFESIAELIAHLKQNPLSHSAVLIKGSRSMQMEQLIHQTEIWK